MFPKLLQGNKALVTRAPRRCLAACLLLLLACMLTLPAQAALTAVSIEQVRAEKPQIDLYCYGGEGSFAPGCEADAYLDGEKLEFIGVQDHTEYDTSYIFLLDISGSIRKAYFDAAKEQLAAFAQQAGPGDTITLITFGSTVELLAEGCADPDQVASLLEGLRSTDQETYLYAAISAGLDYAQAQGGAARQVMVVLSDGIQAVMSAGTTRKEVEAQLLQANVPIYSLCVDYASLADQEEFGAFARATGGQSFAFSPRNAASVWSELQALLASCRRLVFQSADNRIDGELHTLLLKYRSGQTEESHTKQFGLFHWKPDQDPPQLLEAEYLPEKQGVLLRFSEPVLGADEAAAYQLTCEGQQLAAAGVAVHPDGSYLVQLPQELGSGSCTLHFSGIVDDSMEENQLDAPAFAFEVAAPAEPGPGKALYILLGLAAAALAMLIAWLVWRARRPHAAPVQKVEYTVQHISPEAPPAAPPPPLPDDAVLLKLGLLDGSGVRQSREVQVRGSSIWGRSAEMCDVCLADRRISHQHCVLEVKDGQLLITDLGSQNGTYLNGVRLVQATPLHTGDSLRLGDTSIWVEGILA